MKKLLHHSDELTRRKFATQAAGSFLGVNLLPHMQSFGADTPAKAKNVIYLFMSGGMSHIDTLDPKPGSKGQGQTKTIKTNVPGIELGEYMTNLAKHMDKAAIVRALNSTQGSHTHGRYFMRTSYAKRGTIVHPTLGAWVNRFSDRQGRDIPDYVRVGSSSSRGAGFFEAKYSPLPVAKPGEGLENSTLHKDVSQKQFNHRLNLADKLDQAYRERYDRKDVRAYTDMYSDAIKLMQSKELEVFDLSQESDKTRKAYGSDSFGQGCLLARRLVENDVKWVEVTLGEWDHHYKIFDSLPDKASRLDQVLGALLDDLTSRGLIESTLVVVATEFGREPFINGRAGRGHYPRAFSCLLAGGGIQGGQVYGATDDQGREAIENQVSVPDFNATIAHLMGMPLDHVLYSPSARPFKIAHNGKPILDLI
ncbi:MAG: DUF1501 domain-containing protein [Verrucomicrobiota bacterium]